MKEILLRCKYANDGFLWLVLAYSQNQYITWMYNQNDNGYFSGTYHESFGDALTTFLKRISVTTLLNLSNIQYREIDCPSEEVDWKIGKSQRGPWGGLGSIEVEYAVLVSYFGEPDIGDQEKTEVEWVGSVDGYQYSIYDYKEGKCWAGDKGKDVKQITDWHIGGRDPVVVHMLYAVIGGEIHVG